MRYFLVRYVRRPNGQMDELVEASKNLRMKDYQYCAVILDFKTQKVVQASLDGTTIPKDWWKIRDFYHKHYKQMIEDIEAFHGLKAVEIKPDVQEEKQDAGDQS